MDDPDGFSRSYLFVDTPGPATADQVAELLAAAATALRAHGQITVQHIAVDLDDYTNGTCSLTVYYNRIERRRYHRG